ncbi:MAG: glycosyltransferase family 2 protein [bacterium]
MCKLTIVTVNYNNYSGLEKTIKSIIKQTNKVFEHIIIDGHSTDNSVDIIKKYQKHITFWLSEKDKGLFDAMNKGVSLSKGEYVIFMNSGDCFSSENVLEMIQPYLIGYDLIYGDNIITYPWLNYKRYRKAGEIKNLWKGLQFSHQSLFTRKSLLIEHPFNYQSYAGADTEFILYCYYERKCTFIKVNLCISEIEAGGVSDQKRNVKDRLSILRNYDPNYKIHKLYYMIVFTYLKIVKLFKSIVPKKTLKVLYSLKYSMFK